MLEEYVGRICWKNMLEEYVGRIGLEEYVGTKKQLSISLSDTVEDKKY